MATSDPGRKARDQSPEATSRGILSDGALAAHYYTTEPSPDRWIAVGTVMFWPEPQRSRSPRWMLVGSGRSEREAVADLRLRMRQNEPPPWRIKCDPPDRASHHRRNDDQELTGKFVVPWEIEGEEQPLPFETALLDDQLI